MKTFSAAEMRKLDEAATKRFGIPTLLLMENAGRGIAELAEGVKTILIVCGSGNNGGDGFVAARHLWNRGHRVYVILMGRQNALKNDAKLNFNILKKMHVPVDVVNAVDKKIRTRIQRADLIIDAIFGTGLSREIAGNAEAMIELINQSKKRVLSIDMPSGIHSDSGKVMGVAVKANITGTLGVLKCGLVRKPGSVYAGKIKILDISIPRQLMR